MRILDSLGMSWTVWVWKHTPNCAEMSRLASRSLEQPFSLSTRLKMCLDFLICAWYRRYQQQLKFLQQAAPRLGERFGEAGSRGLLVDARRRILQHLLDVRAG